MKKAPTKAQREAAKRLLALDNAANSFEGFVRLLHPDWDIQPFQLTLINLLDQLERGGLKAKNLVVTMPPRHAKSTFSTVYFPAYYMARNPQRFVMSASYNAQLAIDFGRQVRATVTHQEVQHAFPHLHLAQDSRAADTWRTEDGGAYYGVGLGGTTTGRAANLLVIDDPIKSREEAESMTQRDKVWDYYTAALSTRLQPDTRGNEPIQVVCITRWHPDDLVGRLQQTEEWQEGRWHHVDFPAITTTEGEEVEVTQLPEGHPQRVHPDTPIGDIPRKNRYVKLTQEHALWPSRFPLEDLHRRRRLNPRDFESLYQQRPYIEGGNLIKTDWWQRYPIDLNPENFQAVVISVDPAFKSTEVSDYSAIIVAGLDRSGDIYILHVERGRHDFPTLKARLIALNNKWRGKGLRAVYIEDRASGQSLVQELKRESGMAVIPYKVVHDKTARVNAILPLIEGGRVYLPTNAPWLDTFIDECVTFPAGTHDDQVDAMVIAVDVLSRTATTPEFAEFNIDLTQSLRHRAQNLTKSFGNSLNRLAGKDQWKGWGL